MHPEGVPAASMASGSVCSHSGPWLDTQKKAMARCRLRGAGPGLESSSLQPHSSPPPPSSSHGALGDPSLRELDGSLGVSMATSDSTPSGRMVYLNPSALSG